MSVSDIFTLKKPIGPCLVHALYILMLVLITLAVVIGIARGVATMVRPQGPRIAVVRPAPPPPAAVPATPAQPTPAAQTAAATEPAAPPASAPAVPSAPAATPAAPTPQAIPAPPPGPRFLRRDFRGDRMGPRFERRHDGRDRMLVGSLQIVRALVAGAIAVMVIRILAEMALAVLRTGEKKDASPAP